MRGLRVVLATTGYRAQEEDADTNNPYLTFPHSRAPFPAARTAHATVQDSFEVRDLRFEYAEKSSNSLFTIFLCLSYSLLDPRCLLLDQPLAALRLLRYIADRSFVSTARTGCQRSATQAKQNVAHY